MAASQSYKEQRPWEVKFSDGTVKMYHSIINPAGLATKYLHSQQEKGHMKDVIIVNIRPVSREAMNKPIAPTNRLLSLQEVEEKFQKENARALDEEHEAFLNGQVVGKDPSPLLPLVPEKEIPTTEEINEEADSILLNLINLGSDRVDFLAQAYIKFYELATDPNGFYDSVFLIAFAERISRHLVTIDDNLAEIIKNLEWK